MTAQRLFFIVFAVIMAAGIWLTGYQTVHWLLYIPLAGAVLAAITGFCPSLWLYRKMGLPDVSASSH